MGPISKHRCNDGGAFFCRIHGLSFSDCCKHCWGCPAMQAVYAVCSKAQRRGTGPGDTCSQPQPSCMVSPVHHSSTLQHRTATDGCGSVPAFSCRHFVCVSEFSSLGTIRKKRGTARREGLVEMAMSVSQVLPEKPSK